MPRSATAEVDDDHAATLAFSFQLSPLSDSPPSQHLTRGRFPVQVAARSSPEQLRSVTDEHLPAANLDVPEPRNSASRLRQASAAVRHLSTVLGNPR